MDHFYFVIYCRSKGRTLFARADSKGFDSGKYMKDFMSVGNLNAVMLQTK